MEFHMSVRFKSLPFIMCLGLLGHAKADAYSFPWLKNVVTTFATKSCQIFKQYAPSFGLGVGAMGTAACIVDYCCDKERYDVLNRLKKDLDNQREKQTFRTISELPESFGTEQCKQKIKAFNEQLEKHRKNAESDKLAFAYYAQEVATQEKSNLENNKQKLLKKRKALLEKYRNITISDFNSYLNDQLPDYEKVTADEIRKTQKPSVTAQDVTQEVIDALQTQICECKRLLNAYSHISQPIKKDIVEYLNALNAHAKAFQENCKKIKKIETTINAFSLEEPASRCKEMCSRYQELYNQARLIINKEQPIMQKSYQRAWRCTAIFLAATAAVVSLKLL